MNENETTMTDDPVELVPAASIEVEEEENDSSMIQIYESKREQNENTGIAITLHDVVLKLEVPKELVSQGEEKKGSKLEKVLTQRRFAFAGCWQNSKTKKTVLHGITGVFHPGQMYALLGPSGAGKTSLLDVISQRKTVGDISGRVLFDGRKVSKMRLKTDTAYIQQQDVLLGYFTVYEYILFHAFLKLPQAHSGEEKKRRCIEVMEKLCLQKCKDCRIGDPMKRGVSGGERKRVCIALGMLTEPKCIFLDEPTSGLDSHISYEVMQAVRNLADEGRTIICTIHQPSQVIYKMFDCLVILGSGHLIYWGLGKEIAKNFFINLGFQSEGYDNTAEFLLDVVSGGIRCTKGHNTANLAMLFKMTNECTKMDEIATKYLENFNEHREKSNDAGMVSFKLIMSMVQGLHGSSDKNKESSLETSAMSATSGLNVQTQSERNRIHFSDGYANSSLRELFLLTVFKARAHFKDPHFLGTRIACPLLFSCILSSFWASDQSQNNQSIAQQTELAGLLFIIVGTNVFLTTFFVPAIMEERPVFIKERHDACYRVMSYVLHKIIIEAVANIPAVILFSAPIYFSTALVKEKGAFLFFMLTLFVLNVCSSMLALSVASLCPNMEIAGAIVPAILSLCALAGGFLKALSSLPVWWQWLNVVEFLGWGYSALMMNQFQDRTWWYCLPPSELSNFLSGGGGDGSSELGGAMSLLGNDGEFDAQCRYLDKATEYVPLDLQQCMLPVAIEVANSCFPPDFTITNILSCNQICAPVEGSSILEYFAMEWRMNRWASLGFLAVQLPFFFIVFYLATRFMKHESR